VGVWLRQSWGRLTKDDERGDCPKLKTPASNNITIFSVVRLLGTIMTSLKDSRRRACQEVNYAEWVWRADDGMTTLLCGAGHAGPRPFMTIRSPVLHPIKRCVIQVFGLATNQHYFGAAGESLLRGKSDGSLSGFCTSLATRTATEAIRSAGWLRRYWVSTRLV
jgi:hypothetical protein